MKDIRIGNDIVVRWELYNQKQAFDLSGKDVKLYLKNKYGEQEIDRFSISGNAITFTFYGKDQLRLGKHSLEVVISIGEKSTITTDACDFVNFVPCSCNAGGNDDTGVTTQVVDLQSELSMDKIVSYDDTELRQLINTKIDKTADDYYPQLSVGTADNLSGVDEVDSEFSFRRSGGGAIADGVARVQSIKGNSVVWNNLVDTRDKVGDSGWVYRSNDLHLTQGHKYALIRSKAIGGLYCIPVINGQEIYDYSLRDNINASIFTSAYTTTPSTTQLYCEQNVGAVILCDLTKMFGSGNEPTTIEEFNARIPMGIDLYSFNEGEVIDMNVQGIKSVGRNVWDEEWESGNFDNGLPVLDSSRIRSKNYIRIIGGKQYASTKRMSFFFYDRNKDYISSDYDVLTTSPQNACYMKFAAGSSSEPITTYKNDICINLSDSDFNGQYEPYMEASEDLSIVAKYFPQGMKSTDTDSDAIRYNKVTNSWEKRVAIKSIKLKDLNWTYVSEIGYFFSDSIDAQGSIDGINISCICAQYQPMKWIDFISNYMNAKQKAVALYTHPSGAVRVNICDTEFADVASFLASLTDDDVLYYSAKEPIVTEIEEKDFNLDYKVWNCGTEQMVASKPSSALSADITYGFNAVGLIKQLRSMIEALSAKVANL